MSKRLCVLAMQFLSRSASQETRGEYCAKKSSSHMICNDLFTYSEYEIPVEHAFSEPLMFRADFVLGLRIQISSVALYSPDTG